MLQGIDISGYQPPSYSTSGLSFVFIKITEGTSYVNPNWVAQRQVARDHGLVNGFYHYPHIANDPIAEADHFLNQINLVAGDILVLDWEWYGQKVTDDKGQDITNQRARDYRAKFIPYLKSKAPGHKVIVYCDRNTWKTVDQTSYAGDGLWIADYVTAGQPRIQDPWVFHQYSDAASQGGDADVANPALFPGGMTDLKRWAGLPVSSGGTGTHPTPTPTTPTPKPSADRRRLDEEVK
jgi:GH25 family lysozyme M1 (1,4-beta-N-acetylmuramidase)